MRYSFFLRNVRFIKDVQQIPITANIIKVRAIIEISRGKWKEDELLFEEIDSEILVFEDCEDVEVSKEDPFIRLLTGKCGIEYCEFVLITFVLLFFSPSESGRERDGENDGLTDELGSSTVHVILRPARERKVRIQ